jgi:hypothetical protein
MFSFGMGTAMKWQSAIDKNCMVLKGILATLFAMVAVSGDRSARLPRHLHRFALRLLRPAESAARRLIIVAARGLSVEFQPPRLRNHMPLRRRNRAVSEYARPLPLFDALVRSGVGERRVGPGIGALNAGPWAAFSGQRNQIRPVPLSPEDSLDATRLHRRIEALGRALDDLRGHAKRMARWQAQRDAFAVLEREADISGAPTEGHHVAVGHGESKVPRSATHAHRKSRHNELFTYAVRPHAWAAMPDPQVLNNLHGLAASARERPDTS